MSEISEAAMRASCVYSRYDVGTLTPTTSETEMRGRELFWSPQDFKGRTVLDIGSNSGALTIMALQLGAAHVTAVDPTPRFAEHLAEVAQLHSGLKLRVICTALNRLDPNSIRADVVLFMEVLHWAVDQGMPVPEVISRLWQLTGEILFIEFPWSIAEPSIVGQTGLTEKSYSADAIIEELTKAFADVRIVSFMHYFGLGNPARRVLIRCCQPRPEYIVTSTQANTYSVGCLGERSSNYIAPLVSPGGPALFKKVADSSCLSRLPLDQAETLLRDIVNSAPKCLVAPIPIGDSYLREWRYGRYILQPRISRERISFLEFRAPVPEQLLDAIVGLRRDLRAVRLSDAAELWKNRLMNPVPSGPGSVSTLLSRFDGSAHRDLLERLLETGLRSRSEARELCHSDLQEGNIIVSEQGVVHVVDLDTISFGTAFSDGLCALIWAGGRPESFNTLLDRLEAEESVRCGDADFGFSLMKLVQWFEAIETFRDPESEENARRALRGISSLLAVRDGRHADAT
jgi:SAM-dependent methyltransferase